MSGQTGHKSSFFEKLATFIVDKRNLIFFFYVAALIFCLYSRSLVQVCDDLTAYLPADSETRQGLTLMEDEFTTFGTARVMVSNVTYPLAQSLAEQMGEIEGVTSVGFDDTEDHFRAASALFDVTFDGESGDEISLQGMDGIKALLADYDTYISSEVGYDMSATLSQEMVVILGIAAVIIVLVLLLTSRSYAEIPILLVTFSAAALLNMGTNYWLTEISFVSNSVTVVLQLALAIDYAIIMIHRFTEEREKYDIRSAAIQALSKAIPEISASSLTTISGLAAMMFMQFRIGADMGIVLIKAILFSMLSVFTLMPGLLVLSANALERTQHKSFIPSINYWGKFVIKTRYILTPLFGLCLIGSFLLSNQCPYVYGTETLSTPKKNDRQIAVEKINSTFYPQNIMALLVPVGDTSSEAAVMHALERYEEVDFTQGLANTTAEDDYTLTQSLTPRQFSEMVDIDYELVEFLYTAYAVDHEDYGRVVRGVDSYSVPLMDMFLFLCDQKDAGYVELDEELDEELDDLHQQLLDGRVQLLGEKYSRILISLNLPEESQETFDFLKTIHKEAERYYDKDSIYLVGNSTNDFDLSTSFHRDNLVISVLTVLFVIIVLVFTFQSVGLSILLILVIQGSIWINFSFPPLMDAPVFFLSYLITTSIQMGANIDYAIVISTRYQELKKTMPLQEAVIQALNQAFPTVLTSGSILASAGILISRLSSTSAIVGIGQCLGRGTIISMFLVMAVLPQILMLGDIIAEKTRINIKVPEKTQNLNGTIYVDGRVRGRISGVVDATMHGVIYGEMSAMVGTGTLKDVPIELPEEGETDEIPT